MSYSKLIIFIFVFLYNSMSTAQVDSSSPGIKGPVVNANATKVPRKKTLKYSWVKDSDNDEVMVLDLKIKERLRRPIEQKATTIYDNENASEEIKQMIQDETLGSDKKELAYIVQDGDTLKTIAKKIYGDENKWKQIFLKNAENLKKNRLKSGMELKYEP